MTPHLIALATAALPLSAMLSEGDRSMNMVIIPVPEHLLERTYSGRLVP